MSGGTIIDRPNGIALYQLLVAKSAIGLEMKGLKHSRGSIRKMYALHYGMKPRAKGEDVIARIEQEIKKLEEAGDLGIRQF